MRESMWSSISGLILQMPAIARPGEGCCYKPEPHLDLPRGPTLAAYQGVHLQEEGTKAEVEVGLEPKDSNIGCRCPEWHLKSFVIQSSPLNIPLTPFTLASAMPLHKL